MKWKTHFDNLNVVTRAKLDVWYKLLMDWLNRALRNIDYISEIYQRLSELHVIHITLIWLQFDEIKIVKMSITSSTSYKKIFIN